MFKETGYDEFLNEKIRRSDADIAAGRIYTREDATARWQKTIEHKTAELAKSEELHHKVIYG